MRDNALPVKSIKNAIARFHLASLDSRANSAVRKFRTEHVKYGTNTGQLNDYFGIISSKYRHFIPDIMNSRYSWIHMFSWRPSLTNSPWKRHRDLWLRCIIDVKWNETKLIGIDEWNWQQQPFSFIRTIILTKINNTSRKKREKEKNKYRDISRDRY